MRNQKKEIKIIKKNTENKKKIQAILDLYFQNKKFNYNVENFFNFCIFLFLLK